MPEPLPVTLRVYRLLSAAATPLAPLLLARRLSRGKEQRARMAERRGESSIARPSGSLIWVHGASVGELTSALPLIERVRERRFNVLVTTGTVTSAGLAEQRLSRGAVHQYVPLDSPRFVRRFIRHWQPDLALFVESDLWPNLMLEATGDGVPLILVNGRLSESSYRRWRHFPRTIANLLQRFDLCLARTTTDGARYEELGAPRVVTTGNLKLDVPAPPTDSDVLASLQKVIAGRPVVAAASTHPGEEQIVIEAHKYLRARFPGLLTIIAPRHPERGPGIADLAKSAGVTPALRSRRERPERATNIYIADTMGELGLIYRLSPIVFIGGSLVPHGGQNPIEAAKLGAAILHGPHVGNFAEIYAALDTANGARPIRSGKELAESIAAWLSDPGARRQVADAAHRTVEELGGALDRTMRALDPYLLQLRLGQARHA
ncbi:MAG TPA: 3-deoxy-D-manno-octulosonic acid transferase [Pseudolabrys sp.]|nr:3-deoxy-D-manno-octulosonic acid transferase [Pseudolabrys sp.]